MMIRMLGIIPIAGYENSYFQAVELLYFSHIYIYMGFYIELGTIELLKKNKLLNY